VGRLFQTVWEIRRLLSRANDCRCIAIDSCLLGLLLLRKHLHLFAAALLVRWDGLCSRSWLVVVDRGIQQLVHVLNQSRKGKIFVHFTAFVLLLNFKFEFAKFLLDFGVDVAGLFQRTVCQLNCVQVIGWRVSPADHACLDLPVRWLPCENDVIGIDGCSGSILLIRLNQHIICIDIA